jgi:hypothetical protein
MWKAFKNVETGVVHAVKLPTGRTPHGYAMDWPMEETREALTCHVCLQFAFQWAWRDAALAAMLPEGELSQPAKSDRRCLICRVPLSRCCC